jgi:hypothetical protein
MQEMQVSAEADARVADAERRATAAANEAERLRRERHLLEDALARATRENDAHGRARAESTRDA